MAVYFPYSVRCRCGHSFQAHLAQSINIGRAPQLRAAILDGSFHRVQCSECGQSFTVEKPFSYVDFKTNTVLSVRPRHERHAHRRASRELASMLGGLPDVLSPKGSRTARVVFGLQELREKLAAQDAGVDDRLIELMKVYLLQEHPFLLQKPRLRLVFHQLRGESYEFFASHDHSPGKFAISVPAQAVQALVRQRPRLEALLDERHDSSPFKEEAPWVNLWRYSPQTSALEVLERLTEQVRQGGQVDFDSKDFQSMLKRLPRGAHLSSWAKQALLALSRHARGLGRADVQDALFEVRFGLALDDDWAKNGDNEDIDVLWDLLKDLPESNVEGNAFIRELQLDPGEAGGWYSPTSHDIGIGEAELGSRESFQDVVRHEIGHAVHEQHLEKVDAWLKERFGWQRFPTTDTGINQWVGLMGGWGRLTATERTQVRKVLRSAVGGGYSWEPLPFKQPPARHPWWKKDLGARLAYERTGAQWYEHHTTWYRARGKAFFVNFYYGELMVLDDKTSQLISRMSDPYAAMSPAEFFAELYAVYHDLDDPTRVNIPGDVARWLEEETTGKPAPRGGRGKRVA